MKLLVATSKGQGVRKNDFCWVTEDEIVHFGSECDGEGVDGECGCRRAMVGLDSSKATTTMKVSEVELTEAQLIGKIADFYVQSWKMSQDEAFKMAKSEAKDLIKLGAYFQIASVVEKRGGTFKERKAA